MDALDFLGASQSSNNKGSAVDFLNSTSAPERTFTMKAIDLLTMGHVYGEPGPENELAMVRKAPYRDLQPGLDPRVKTGDPGFFQDPVTALAMGGVAGVRAAAGPIGKLIAGGRETLGWFTGGASEAPAMLKGGIKAAVKAAEAKPLAELAAKRAGVQFAEVPVKLSAEEFLSAPASKVAAESVPQVTKSIREQNDNVVPLSAVKAHTFEVGDRNKISYKYENDPIHHSKTLEYVGESPDGLGMFDTIPTAEAGTRRRVFLDPQQIISVVPSENVFTRNDIKLPLGKVVDFKQLPSHVGEKADISPANKSAILDRGNFPVERMKISEIHAKPDELQFKLDTNAEGVQEPLKGKWNELAAGNFLLWEDKSGTRYVANGHHRLAKAKEQGIDAVNAQVLKEADGYSINDARRIAAESNILEGKGTIYDQAEYFRLQPETYTPDVARSRGIAGRGYTIGQFATPDTYTQFRTRAISPEAAEAISKGAPNEASLQNAGVKYSLSNPKADPYEIENFIKALSTIKRPTASGDLFGFDDSSIQIAEKMGKAAAAEIRTLRDQIAAVQGAAKRPETARGLGVDVKDPEAIKAKIIELKGQVEEWGRWSTNPEKVAELKKKAGFVEERPSEVTNDIPGMSYAETFGLANPDAPKSMGEFKPTITPPKSKDIFSAMQNEKGAINPNLLTLGTTKFLQDDVIPTSKSLYGVMKNSAKDIRNAFSPASAGEGAQATAEIMRTNLAEMARSTDQAQFALQKARNYFTPKDPQFNYDFIDKIETGANHPDIFLSNTANTMRDLLDKKAAEVQKLGTGKLQSLIEDYFPHMWADPKKANEAFQNWYAKRPMEGSKSFLKQRTIPTTREGLEMGLTPISDNPVDLAILKLREMDKYIMAQKTLKSMKDNGLATFVRSGHKPPEGYVPINDKIASVYVSTEKYGKTVNEESITRDINHVNNILKETSKTETTGGMAGSRADVLIEGKVLEALRARGWAEGEAQQMLSKVKAAPAGGEKTITIDKETQSIINTMVTHRIEKGFIPGKGFVNTGNYYAPEDAARIINNYLSPGLRGNQGFRAYLGAANVLNQAQLGLSAFHLGFTSLDAMVSKMALAMNQGAHGAFGQAAKSLVEVPISPVSNILRGNKLYKEWMMPGTQDAGIGKLVDAVVTAGGRARMDKFYATEYAKKAADAFRKGNILGGIVRTPFALADLAAKPIMEYIVPRQKLGVFADLAKYELERLGKAGAPESEIQTALGKIWDSVDNRMGQLVYDNLFWNKMGKDLGMASVRSLGWNLGTVREIGGGGVDLLKAIGKVATGNKPELTYRMAYTASLPVLTGMMGGTLNYLMTGEAPKELKDYYFPRTGKLDETGRPDRVSLPSYIKDLVHYYEQPVKTVTNKLHPALSMIGQMLSNEDFYGVQIADWSEGAMDTLTNPQTYKDYGEYLGKSIQPFGIRNLIRQRQLGGGVVDQALPFVGITPAPAAIAKTKAENMMAAFLKGRIPNAAITKDQADIYDTKKQLLSSIRQGKAISPEVAGKLQNLSPRQLDNIMADVGKDYFEKLYKSLTLREALEVYNAGTPKEKGQALPILTDKIQSNLGGNPEQVKKLLPKIKKVFGIQ